MDRIDNTGWQLVPHPFLQSSAPDARISGTGLFSGNCSTFSGRMPEADRLSDSKAGLGGTAEGSAFGPEWQPDHGQGARVDLLGAIGGGAMPQGRTAGTNTMSTQ